MHQPFDIAIDVGDAQPVMDWAAVYASGIRIVMVKCSEGAGFVSPTFETQRDGATKAGIKVIPYHFIRPGAADLQVQKFRLAAQLVANQAIALDWEGRASQTATPQIVEQIGARLQAITGRVPLGYWGIKGSTPAEPTPAMLKYDRWVPRYPRFGAKSWTDVPLSIQHLADSEWPGALFVQYTMWGQVPGIKGPVDRSVFFGNSVDDALAWYATGARPA